MILKGCRKTTSLYIIIPVVQVRKKKISIEVTKRQRKIFTNIIVDFA